MSSPTTELSVIVPAFNETDNIRPLTERLFAAVKKTDLTVELLFVDDEVSRSWHRTPTSHGDFCRCLGFIESCLRSEWEKKKCYAAVVLHFQARLCTLSSAWHIARHV